MDNNTDLEQQVMKLLGEQDDATTSTPSEGEENPSSPQPDLADARENLASNTPPQPERQPSPSNRDRRPYRDDGRGNLIDEEGNIIARAGAERRKFQAAQEELNALRAEVEAFRTAAVHYRDLGITPQEATAAYQFIAHLKREPVAAVTKLIADLRAAGYDLGQLGGGNIDTAAVRSIVQEAIAPFLQDRQQQIEASQREQTLREGIENFFASDPRYDAHLPELQGIISRMDPEFVQRNPIEALREAGYILREKLLEAGLKFGTPLKQQGVDTGNKPPSNARTPSQGARVAPVDASRGADDPNRPLRSIVADVLREHGLQV